MAKVSAKSLKDIFKYRTCCKVMKAAGESSELYRELYIFGILYLPYRYSILDRGDETLNKCRQHENLFLMFREGMFFQFELLIAGNKTKLQMTTGKGQKDAIFVNTMLLLVESRRIKEEALRMLNAAFRGS